VSTAVEATVRHAVAAVRACDAAAGALVSLLSERVTTVGAQAWGGQRTQFASAMATASSVPVSPATGYSPLPPGGSGPADLDRYSSVPGYSNVRASTPLATELPAYSSRANWPLVGDPLNNTDEAPNTPANARSYPRGPLTASDAFRQMDLPRQREGRATPPWQIDDLPAEPPALRLVEPAPLADPALSADRRYSEFDRDLHYDPPPLRLIDADRQDHDRLASGPPVSTGGDGDLLIFAATRSAWFISHIDVNPSSEVDWSNSSDLGWRAAEQAAQRSVAAETVAGLPVRVPQQNLVPGSAASGATERPLHIVRDPAAIAAHTSGYFRGWQRGQEVGGYRVGGRPGRESAGGWDFVRESEDDRDVNYRPASRR
jgi:hypothetical protein